MPYVLLRTNNKPAGLSGGVFLEQDLENLRRNSKKGETYTFVNVITRRIVRVKGGKS